MQRKGAASGPVSRPAVVVVVFSVVLRSFTAHVWCGARSMAISGRRAYAISGSRAIRLPWLAWVLLKQSIGVRADDVEELSMSRGMASMSMAMARKSPFGGCSGVCRSQTGQAAECIKINKNKRGRHSPWPRGNSLGINFCCPCLPAARSTALDPFLRAEDEGWERWKW